MTRRTPLPVIYAICIRCVSYREGDPTLGWPQLNASASAKAKEAASKIELSLFGKVKRVGKSVYNKTVSGQTRTVRAHLRRL